MPFVTVASLDELPQDEVIAVEPGGRKLALARIGDEVYAFDDNCSHREFPLSQGELDPEDCSITCEWHGARFDVRTGEALCLPATRPIAVYPCRVDGREIQVDLPG